jgi:ribonuclease P protein component
VAGVHTIRSSREIDALFRGASRASRGLVGILAAPTPAERDSGGRVAFIAGKKLGNAVLRNRSKRVLRACVRRLGGPWAGWDVALLARTGLATAGAATVDAQVADALRELGVSP